MMSILSWLKEVTTGDNKAGHIDTGSMTFAKGEEEFQGLDMKAALDAHAAWVKRLEDRLNGVSEERLDIATVSSDCQCVLGKWLYSDALRQFGESGEYLNLRQVHADFHRKAGETLSDVVKGDREQAVKNLRDLRCQSNNVQLSLVRLYSHMQH
jgi:hypothetical protein